MEGEAYYGEAARFPMLNATRAEEDFTKNIKTTIETDPNAGWIFVSDNLFLLYQLTITCFVAISYGCYFIDYSNFRWLAWFC